MILWCFSNECRVSFPQDIPCYGRKRNLVNDLLFSHHAHRETGTGYHLSTIKWRIIIPIDLIGHLLDFQIERMAERKKVTDGIDSLQNEIMDMIKLMGSPGTTR